MEVVNYFHEGWRYDEMTDAQRQNFKERLCAFVKDNLPPDMHKFIIVFSGETMHAACGRVDRTGENDDLANSMRDVIADITNREVT